MAAHIIPETNIPEFVWLNQVDAVDPFFGDQEILAELVTTAPTLAHAAWLASQVEDNNRFTKQMFSC